MTTTPTPTTTATRLIYATPVAWYEHPLNQEAAVVVAEACIKAGAFEDAADILHMVAVVRGFQLDDVAHDAHRAAAWYEQAIE